MKDLTTENNIRVLFSKNLRRLRLLQNKSQLTLALDAGLTHNFINDIEKCKKGVSIRTLAKLSAALKVEPYQFFLPDVEDNTLVYINDFNDSLQKLVKEMTIKYTQQ